MNCFRHSVIVSVAFGLMLVFSYFVYQPGLSGPFLVDDFDNLSALEGGVEDWGDVKHYLDIGNAGPLGRPIAKLTFLLDDNNWPSNPSDFKLTNLLIHLLVGVFVFVFLRCLGRYSLTARSADWVALAAMAIWLLHPMQVSTVLYIVQRMTQLSTLFILVGVSVHILLRMKYPAPGLIHLMWLSLSMGFFTILAILSKESGALLPVFVAVVEFTILSGKKSSALFIWWKRMFLLLPTAAIISYVAYFPKWIGSYANRDFSLTERLLTQLVVLWDYLASLFNMRVHQLGLFQDDYPVYSSLWDAKVFLAFFGTVAVIAFALMSRRRYPVLSFGILWFFAGHIIESSAVPLELYFEHRNYLPFVGPIFAFVVLVHLVIRKFLTDLANFEFVIFGLLIMIIAGTTWGYSSEWGNSQRIIPIWAAEHPDSLRAQRTFAQHLASVGYPDAALDIIDDTYKAFPHDLSLPLMSVSLSCAFDRQLRYDLSELEKKWMSINGPMVCVPLLQIWRISSIKPRVFPLPRMLPGFLGKPKALWGREPIAAVPHRFRLLPVTCC